MSTGPGAPTRPSSTGAHRPRSHGSGMRGLVVFLLAMWIVTSLPVWGMVANEAAMWGPLPAAILWCYAGYFVIMLAAFRVYQRDFKPWSLDFEARMTGR